MICSTTTATFTQLAAKPAQASRSSDVTSRPTAVALRGAAFRSRAPGTGHRIARPTLCRSAETEAVEADGMFVDEDAMLAAQNFALSPEELVCKTKEFLASSNRDPATMGGFLAEDFVFMGPVVGPLGKEELLNALGNFDLLTGFPDLKSNFHHFRACPYEPGRVWFTWRPTATHTGKLMGVIEPTGIQVESPPQTHSLVFNEEGKVIKQTVGYVNDRSLGNTGGLGGIYGLLYAVGSPLPFPEANPWKKSKRYRLFQWVTSLTRSAAKKEEEN